MSHERNRKLLAVYAYGNEVPWEVEKFVKILAKQYPTKYKEFKQRSERMMAMDLQSYFVEQ